MSSPIAVAPSLTPPFGPLLLRTGLTIAIVDALWAVALTAAYGGSQLRLWQGVAAVPFGKAMLDGGIATYVVGLGVHLCVAFTWSAVFIAIHRLLPAIRSLLDRRQGIAVASMVYGPLIWIFMSRVAVPLRTGNPPAPITTRWLIQLAGHALFVGLPVVATVAWAQRRVSRDARAR